MSHRLHDLPDPELERALAEVGRRLASPPLRPDLPAAVGSSLRARLRPTGSRGLLALAGRWAESRRALRPLLRPAWQPAAAAVLSLLLVLTVALSLSPGARRAVAGWLGVGGVRVRVEATSPAAPVRPLGGGMDLGVRASLERAREAVEFPLLLPRLPELGAPDEVYLGRDLPGGRVTLVYRSRPGIPEASTSGVGLLLMAFRGSFDEETMAKVAGPGTVIRPVEVDGAPGLWITGRPHRVFLLDEGGRPVADSVRLAGNVLLWVEGGVTYRLEGDVPLQLALRVARSLG
ncbi:MAG TPA: hypothetical protein VNO34_09635 [Actinomycetota bacterium]|nr:hypothetical protein [Actinomycetota bacterium]